MELGQRARQARELLQVGFARLGALVVGHRGDDDAIGRRKLHGACKQRARLFALARRQHQHQGMARLFGYRIGNDAQAGAFQQFGIGTETLFAYQLRQRELAQRGAIARAQEQHRPGRPGEHALGEGKHQGIES